MDSLRTHNGSSNPFELQYEVSDDWVCEDSSVVFVEIDDSEVDLDTVVDAHPYGGNRIAPRARVASSTAYLSAERVLISRQADVSMSGIFVATANPDPVGTRASVFFQDEREGHEFHAEVVRVSFVSSLRGTGRGMGLRFLDITAAQRKFLAEYVALNHQV